MAYGLKLQRKDVQKLRATFFHFTVVSGKGTFNHPLIHEAISGAGLKPGDRVGTIEVYHYPEDDKAPNGTGYLYFYSFFPWKYGIGENAIPIQQRSFGAQTMLRVVRALKRTHGEKMMIQISDTLQPAGAAFLRRLKIMAGKEHTTTLGVLEAQLKTYLALPSTRAKTGS